jgi:hypothetical protein
MNVLGIVSRPRLDTQSGGIEAMDAGLRSEGLPP